MLKCVFKYLGGGVLLLVSGVTPPCNFSPVGIRRCYAFHTISADLRPPDQFCLLDPNDVSDTLRSTLTLSLNDFCPVSTRPTHSLHWQLEFPVLPVDNGQSSGQLSRSGGKQRDPVDLAEHQSLLCDFPTNLTAVKTTYWHAKISISRHMGYCSPSRCSETLQLASSLLITLSQRRQRSRHISDLPHTFQSSTSFFCPSHWDQCLQAPPR